MKKNSSTGAAGATRLVYSTDAGRMCPECGQPVAQCACRANRALGAAAPSDGIVRVSHETKGRKGKGVTLIKGLARDVETLAQTAKQLKATCGSGGTVKDGTIEIQGDHRELVIAALVKLGKTVKRAGG
ncbi:translation initiation factor Sui1 [Variovorax sp. PAMC 28711]|uniref:translation initiation factor Sui1 n=1 Tax=Variovorax sp. PAMC 28711 TaxID=1795631 RepID=UPI00078E817C|nr:translation initiation factor Sui1 [Variovorax sp. PAMC 28711]AMM24241.1 translation initiation factor SUI1 [Variovorax sp. PAMC 28711]